jgi:hypothetical protein
MISVSARADQEKCDRQNLADGLKVRGMSFLKTPVMRPVLR